MADLSLTAASVERAYVGYSPRFTLTLSNSASTAGAYNMPIRVNVYPSDDGQQSYICYGYTACYLEPGESKTITVDCRLDDYQSLQDGTYYIKVLYSRGENDLYNLLSTGYEDFEMTTPAAADLSYSNPAIDKTQLCRGDRLTATLDITNAGGYTAGKYGFAIFDPNGGSSIKIFDSGVVDLPNGTKRLSMSGTLDLEQDSYRGFFFDLSTNTQLTTEPLRFTVVETGDDIPTSFPLIVSDNDYYTLYLPFNAEIPEEVTAYIGQLDETRHMLGLVEIGGNLLPANTAVMIRVTGATVTGPTVCWFEGLNVGTEYATTDQNDLEGVHEPTLATALQNATPADDICLTLGWTAANGLAFYAPASGTVDAHKAYLMVPSEWFSADTPIRIVEVTGEETAVEEAHTAGAAGTVFAVKVLEGGHLFIEKNGIRYSLTGQVVK